MPDKNKQLDFDYNKMIQMQKDCIVNLLKDMFPQINRTFIGIMIGNVRKTFSVKYIIDNVDSFVGKKSVYFTGNIIKPMKNRCQSNVSVLNDVYLDLDTNHYKKSPYVTPVDAFEQVQEFITEKKILKPSLIINTTRGLQLHWFIDPITVTKKRISLWKSIEDSLMDMFYAFYPDGTVAKDYSRLLRFPFTVNEKSNDLSEIMDYDGERYSIGELASCFLQKETNDKVVGSVSSKSNGVGEKKLFTRKEGKKEGKATSKQIKYVKDLCKALKIDDPCVSTYEEANLFIRKYKNQLVPVKKRYTSVLFSCPKLGDPYKMELEKRNAKAIESYVLDHPQNNHCRETLLFLYRLAQLHIEQDEEVAWEKVRILNSKYRDPFNEGKLNKLTYSAVRYYKKGDTRWYGPHAIERMVTGDNNCDSVLPYFYPDKKKRDCREYNKAYYEKKLLEQNQDKKSVQIQKRRSKVKELRSAGYSYDAIAKELGVSKKTIQRDMLSFNCCEKKEDKFSSNNLLNIYTSGISPLGDFSSLSGDSANIMDQLDEEDVEDMVIFNELYKEKLRKNSTDQNKQESFFSEKDMDPIIKQDVVKAFYKLNQICNEELELDEHQRVKLMHTIDAMLFYNESIDVFEINNKNNKNNKNKDRSIHSYKQIHTFGKTIVYLSRERKAFIKDIFVYLDHLLQNECNLDSVKENLYTFIVQKKKLKSIDEYYVKKRRQSYLQKINSARVYRQRNTMKELSVLKNTTDDYAVKEAIDRFFHWYNKLRIADKNETFVIHNKMYNKKEFSRLMFFHISDSLINKVANKIRTGCMIEEVLLTFINES